MKIYRSDYRTEIWFAGFVYKSRKIKGKRIWFSFRKA